MKFKTVWLLMLILSLSFSGTVWAGPGGNIKLDDVRGISIGVGLRTSFTSVEDAAPTGTDYSNEFEVENVRLYINASITPDIGVKFNIDRDSSGPEADVRVLDAVGIIHIHDLFQIWGGRFNPPSDRSNLSGPYYLNIWDFPFVSAYPTIFNGRDDGVAIWGITGDERLRYQLGVFDGTNGSTTSNQEDNLLYAGRLTYNFWDPEPAIYYSLSTYYGDIDVLAIGLAGMIQEDGAGTPASSGDYGAWNVDFLMEKRLGNKGVVTLEGAYYDYDLDGLGAIDSRGLTEGESWFALASYMFPQKLGWGQIQPVFRYQELERDVGGTHRRWDVGVNYIISGHNARISAIYSNDDDPSNGIDSVDRFKLGLQLQLF